MRRDDSPARDPEWPLVWATCAMCGETFLTAAPIEEIDAADIRCAACDDEESEDAWDDDDEVPDD